MDVYIFVIVLCASSLDFGKCEGHDTPLQHPDQTKTHFRNARFLVDQNSTHWMSEQQRVSCATTCIEAYKNKTLDCCRTGNNRICFNVPLDILRNYIGQCDVDGQWADWSAWGSCSRSCSGGTTTRLRTCSNPFPQYGGRQCVGNFTDVKHCFDIPCPIDGQWADWGAWGPCSRSCSDGTTTRVRMCSNPLPQYGGKSCVGNFGDVKHCFEGFCPTTTPVPTHRHVITTRTTSATPTTDPAVGCKIDGYIYDAPTRLCFKFFEIPKLNWTEAQQFCNRSKGRLAFLTGEQKVKDILQLYKDDGYTSKMWVGATDLGNGHVFHFTDGSTLILDPADGKDLTSANCQYMIPGSYKLFDTCREKNGFICERSSSVRD